MSLRLPSAKDIVLGGIVQYLPLPISSTVFPLSILADRA
jgi:hypothetical protein